MTAEPSPRPWRISDPFEDGFPAVRDMDGRQIATMDGETPFQNEANAALIVDAVNERDRLRDIVKVLIPVAEMTLTYQEAMKKAGSDQIDGIKAARNEIRKILAEARAAIGEAAPSAPCAPAPSVVSSPRPAQNP